MNHEDENDDDSYYYYHYYYYYVYYHDQDGGDDDLQQVVIIIAAELPAPCFVIKPFQACWENLNIPVHNAFFPAYQVTNPPGN